MLKRWLPQKRSNKVKFLVDFTCVQSREREREYDKTSSQSFRITYIVKTLEKDIFTLNFLSRMVEPTSSRFYSCKCVNANSPMRSLLVLHRENVLYNYVGMIIDQLFNYRNLTE